MTARLALIAMLALFVSPAAHAGAWDTGPFDNDDALDFVYELADTKSYRMLWSAFGSCMRRNVDYLDSWDGSIAVAAAALVAANISKDTAAVPDELKDWVSEKSWAADVKLVGSARVCLDRVVDSDKSELAQLWAESGLYDEWAEKTNSIADTLRANSED